ncbi:MAG: serine hydrolase domain-containing protein [Terracidiphilus sp.]
MKSEDSLPTVWSVGAQGRLDAAMRVLEEAIAARAFPGCAFGVLVGGEVVLAGARGRFTYDEAAPAVTPETVFDVASLTKVAATTGAAMLLNQRGRLRLETTLGELLPEFVWKRAADDPARRVTLGHLLAHNSGLPGYVEFFRTAATGEALLDACMNLSLQAEPGTRAEYSDPGFILLGKALEALTGEALAEWVGREIFLPLGMTATGFMESHPSQSTRRMGHPGFMESHPSDKNKNVARVGHPEIPPTELDARYRHRVMQGEVQDENAWLLGGVAGHAGLFSNVPDLLRLAREILLAHEGRGQLFDAATIARFAQRQGPTGSSRALGWDTPSQPSSSGRYFSRAAIGHLGFSGCSLWIDLEARIAVALLTNRTWPDRASQLIRQVRPAFHDAVRRAL